MNSQNQNPNNQNHKGSDNRSDMRKHEYKDFEEVLKNDENYDEDTQKFKGEKPDWDDKLNNEEKNK
ncbi:hypothetical protein [Flavobacterium algicola]|uniref:hypothetical protein n=1 Tax=Flavobacterium algicola TaxID=556529 RepID=UPI001EFD5DCC|nr:hypothetical protein [Flavobacterium algicola]MCG9792439.1 hypothetical protein [Flavobacterium algicola]